MSAEASWIMTDNSVTVVIDNEVHTILQEHPNFTRIVNAIKTNDWDLVAVLSNVSTAIVDKSNGQLYTKDGKVYLNDEEVDGKLAERINLMLFDGFSLEPIVNFINNLHENPSYQTNRLLYTFMENNNLPITPDGCFLAYKRVKANYTDERTGTIDNSIGSTVKMLRRKVNDDHNNSCADGLHVGSRQYFSSIGSTTNNKMLLVKVNPKDVVAVPGNDKIRCCEYHVMSELVNDPQIENTAVFEL